MVADHGRVPAALLARLVEVVGDVREDGAVDDDVGRVATGLLGALAHEPHRPLDEERVGDLEDDAVALAARQPQRVRPVGGDVDREAALRPGDLHRHAVDLDRVAAAELPDDVDRALEVGELRGAALHQPHGAVALADAADHAPPARGLLERGERARHHGRVAGARVRHAGAELEALRSSLPGTRAACRPHSRGRASPSSRPGRSRHSSASWTSSSERLTGRLRS